MSQDTSPHLVTSERSTWVRPWM